MFDISVVIPTYNHSEFLGPAIESALGSLGVKVEVFVINDGSTDDTAKVASSHPGIHYFEQTNMGAHHALNRALSLVKTEYVAILNDDDMYEPGHLLSSILAMNSLDADIVISTPEVIGDGQNFERMLLHLAHSSRAIEEYGLIESLLHLNWTVSTSSFVIRTRILAASNAFRDFRMAHDWDFILRLVLLDKARLVRREDRSWKYRIHGANSSNQIPLEFQMAESLYILLSVLDKLNEMSDKPVLGLESISNQFSMELKNVCLFIAPWNDPKISVREGVQILARAVSAHPDFPKKSYQL
jgi:glycosyltransferase involved in cell wall biosynthesis